MSAPSLNTSEEEHTNMMHPAFGKREMTEFILKVSHILETDLQVKSEIGLFTVQLIIQGLSDCAVIAWLCVWLKTEEIYFLILHNAC